MRPVTFLLAFIAGAGGMYFWNHRPRTTTTEMPGLREQLDAAAERNFPVPNLEVKRVEVTVAPEKVDGLIAAAINLAGEFDGTAMQGLDRESAKVVLVTLPKRWLGDFSTAILKYPADPKLPEPGAPETDMVDCEVVIHPQGK